MRTIAAEVRAEPGRARSEHEPRARSAKIYAYVNDTTIRAIQVIWFSCKTLYSTSNSNCSPQINPLSKLDDVCLPHDWLDSSRSPSSVIKHHSKVRKVRIMRNTGCFFFFFYFFMMFGQVFMDATSTACVNLLSYGSNCT